MKVVDWVAIVVVVVFMLLVAYDTVKLRRRPPPSLPRGDALPYQGGSPYGAILRSREFAGGR